MLLHLLPQTSPWDGIRDLQTGTTSWSLFEFLTVNNAEPSYVQKIYLCSLISAGTLLNCCLSIVLFRSGFECGKVSAQSLQLSQTYILQGRRWKIFIGSEIQFERTFPRPRAFKLGQDPSHVWLRTLKLDRPIK